jgi:UDP-glucose 4-epimerase
MKVLITGGAGFIGSSIARELLKNNIETVIIDNLVSGNKRNVPEGSVFYKGDICKDLDHIFAAEQPDYVIHQAAQVSVANSLVDPVYDGNENIIGTINLLKACVKYNTKKIIFSSSAALYGSPKYLPIDEKHPVAPVSPYGLSKLCAEFYIKLFSELYNLNFTILRYSNVFGHRQDVNGEAGVIAIFIERLLKGDSINIYGDGLQTRDFIFVRDVARANVAALTHGDNNIINISSQTQISILDTVKEITKLLNVSNTPIYLDERPGDIKHSILSNEYAKEILKWKPEYCLATGLNEMVEYCQSLGS